MSGTLGGASLSSGVRHPIALALVLSPKGGTRTRNADDHDESPETEI
jgi:hypothetical protein